jgi:hypothetical protein
MIWRPWFRARPAIITLYLYENNESLPAVQDRLRRRPTANAATDLCRHRHSPPRGSSESAAGVSTWLGTGAGGDRGNCVACRRDRVVHPEGKYLKKTKVRDEFTQVLPPDMIGNRMGGFAVIREKDNHHMGLGLAKLMELVDRHRERLWLATGDSLLHKPPTKPRVIRAAIEDRKIGSDRPPTGGEPIGIVR